LLLGDGVSLQVLLALSAIGLGEARAATAAGGATGWGDDRVQSGRYRGGRWRRRVGRWVGQDGVEAVEDEARGSGGVACEVIAELLVKFQRHGVLDGTSHRVWGVVVVAGSEDVREAEVVGDGALARGVDGGGGDGGGGEHNKEAIKLNEELLATTSGRRTVH
jgi:hypothetical protein